MTRKIFLCTLLVLALGLPAHAVVQRFGHFVVNVPSGWTGELQGQTLIVKSDSVNASIAVAFAQMGEASFTDIVERLYVQMSGNNLQQDDDGDYSFTFTNLAGGESLAMVGNAGEGYYVVLSITGYDIDGVQDDLETIMDSVDWED